jgi:hypothetical protein
MHTEIERYSYLHKAEVKEQISNRNCNFNLSKMKMK